MARDIEKTLRSAIANAVNVADKNQKRRLDEDDLVVSAAYADQGPSQKRVRPAPMGRAYQTIKRTTHISVVVVEGAEREAAAKAARTDKAAAKTAKVAKAKSAAQAGGHRGPRRAHQAVQEDQRREGVEVMGQKVHPIGFRLGFNKTWRSRWYAEKEYANLLHEDIKLKKDLKKRFAHAGVSRVDIERAANKLKISIFTSRPGIIIGRKGQEVDKLKQEIQKKTGKEVFINIQEILKPELDAQLVSESVALQLEKRIAFRRAMRKAVDAALRFGAKGIKVRVSGRLNGAEIARSEWYLHGQLPLHTLRADIDYGTSRGQDELRPDRREVLDLQGRAGRAAPEQGAVGNSSC